MSLDDAYERLHASGPERDGWLSNHAPMAVEALARHGHETEIEGWISWYAGKLRDMPAAVEVIEPARWEEALGDPRRIGDWMGFFRDRVREAPWRDVLATWWPRLLPGVAAGATHGVIRVGHAVRTLHGDPASGAAPDTSEAAVAELAQALAYWAARWQPLPVTARPAGTLGAAAALAGVPHIPDRSGGFRDGVARLADLAGWPAAVAAARPAGGADEAAGRLRELVVAAVRRYRSHGYGEPIMLVHAATAPNAVLRTLPALPRELWVDSAATAWLASAAVTALYAPAEAAPRDAVPPPACVEPEREVFDVAAAHRDEHVIKLTDTALDVYGWTGDPDALAAASTAAALIPRR
jgi:hypothetical protein